MTIFDQPALADRTTGPTRRAPERTPRRWRILDWVGWVVVAGLAWLTATRWLDLDEPGRLVAFAQALAPFAYLAAWVTGLAAALTKRWLLAAACAALAVVHVVTVAPALGTTAPPVWAASAPTITVLTANIHEDNPEPDDAARELLKADADVLVLIDWTGPVMRSLAEQGLSARYPHLASRRWEMSALVYSKLPLDSVDVVWSDDNGFPVATFSVEGRAVQLAGVHISSALHGSDNFRSQLDDLERFVDQTEGPLVLAGDFNATRWHPPFADLLSSGLTDAHEARGKGLSRSWPAGLFPWMRLDHVLVSDEVAVLDVRDVDVPGSDHVAALATLAIGPG